MFLWGWDVEFSRQTEQDTGFEFLREPPAGTNEPFMHIAVSDLVMNSNGSVSCQVLSNVSIIARLHISIMRLCKVLVSDINDIFPFPTLSKAVSAILIL